MHWSVDNLSPSCLSGWDMSLSHEEKSAQLSAAAFAATRSVFTFCSFEFTLQYVNRVPAAFSTASASSAVCRNKLGLHGVAGTASSGANGSISSERMSVADSEGPTVTQTLLCLSRVFTVRARILSRCVLAGAISSNKGMIWL
jgi:hypothetical protein